MRSPRRNTATPSPPSSAHPFDSVRTQLRELVLADSGHEAWSVLDRSRVEQILTTPGDEVQQYYAWRIATLFAA